MSTIQTIDIMFTRAGDGEFPTVADIERSDWSLDLYSIDTEPFADWLAIALDPHFLRYADDDNEAMDETNWDALVSDLVGRDGILGDGEHNGPPRVTVQWHSYKCRGDGSGQRTDGGPCLACRVVEAERDEALRCGVAVIGQLLAVAPDNDEDVEAMRDASRNLSNYPLLDEEAYSAREWEAWQEYAPTAWSDEIREAVNPPKHWNRETGEYEPVDGWMDEDTAEALGDANANAILSVINSDLHYYGGFSGEYHPPFLQCFAERFGELLAATAGWGHEWMVRS